jgi:multiple sugar transport system substrate-binding protein
VKRKEWDIFMKKLTAVLLVFMLIMSAFLFTACDSKNQDPQKEETQQTQKIDEKKKEETSKPVKLTIWHDKGEKGLNIFTEIGNMFTEKYPNVTIESVSFPSQEFIDKSIATLNTNSAPDIFFNDWHRLIPVEQQSSKLEDLNSKIPDDQKQMIGKNALTMGFYNNKQIINPHQISFIGLGIRKSWLEKVNGKVPETIDEFIELARKFTYEDPDANGEDDTYGFTGYFGKGSLEFLRYFTLAAGINDIVLNSEGKPSFNEEKRKLILSNFASLYNAEKVVPEDSVSHTYIEMYQMIESEKIGMFRVGNFNVPKWDELFKGDYIITNFPVLNKGDQPTAQLYTMRGTAVSSDSKNKDIAIEFTKFNNTKEAQQVHYKYNASIIRNDLQMEGASTNEKYFMEEIFKDKYKMMNPDLHASEYFYTPKVEEEYEKSIQLIIVEKSTDIDKVIEEAENRSLDIVKSSDK